MATAYAAIVIDDDEDEDENDVPDIAVCEKETKINTLIEILNLSRDQSESALEAAGFDLKVAISAKLDHNPSRPTLSSSSSLKNIVQRSLTSQPVRGDAPQNKLLEKGLSPQWHSCFQNASTPFVDLDFPPTRISLDGRSTATESTTVISCHCQLPATSRTVQTDGPNYGRFYLACGRPRFNRRRNDKATSEKFEYKPCDFFQWDKDGSLGGYSNTGWSQLSWHAFVGPKYVVYRKGMGPDQVRQGAVGNCWFLSALAVVAEKAYLIEKVFPHCTTNDKGCYQVNLCLDGKWAPVMVDAHLPVVLEESTAKPKSLQKQDFRGVALQHGKVAFPAFCAIPQGQLWPALVEKAYAKAHGSYANLSGGFIAEGLADLTGAPFETIIFEAHDNHDRRDELWARLLSFSEAGFLMGVATSRGGDGLVGSHAYSVLKVQEIHGSMVGSQQKMTDFFGGSTSKKAKLDVGASQEKNTASSNSHGREETIRLIRIRNPWGKKGKSNMIRASVWLLNQF
jgi:calpain-15